jgi:hypothetical protein
VQLHEGGSQKQLIAASQHRKRPNSSAVPLCECLTSMVWPGNFLVSCTPESFARDGRSLRKGLELSASILAKSRADCAVWRGGRQELTPPGVGVDADDAAKNTAEMRLITHPAFQGNLNQRYA